MRRKRMSKDMGRNGPGNSSPTCSQLEQLPESLPRQRAAAPRYEEKSRRAASQEPWSNFFEIFLEHTTRRLAHGYYALLRSLSGDAQKADREIHLRCRERYQFRHTQSGCIHQ